MLFYQSHLFPLVPIGACNNSNANEGKHQKFALKSFVCDRQSNLHEDAELVPAEEFTQVSRPFKRLIRDIPYGYCIVFSIEC